MSYACLALLSRFTLLNHWIFVGVGICVTPVKTLRPYLGVSTTSGRSPWFQYAGSSPFAYLKIVTSLPWAPASRFGLNGSSLIQPPKPGPLHSVPWNSADL